MAAAQTPEFSSKDVKSLFKSMGGEMLALFEMFEGILNAVHKAEVNEAVQTLAKNGAELAGGSIPENNIGDPNINAGYQLDQAAPQIAPDLGAGLGTA